VARLGVPPGTLTPSKGVQVNWQPVPDAVVETEADEEPPEPPDVEEPPEPPDVVEPEAGDDVTDPVIVLDAEAELLPPEVLPDELLVDEALLDPLTVEVGPVVDDTDEPDDEQGPLLATWNCVTLEES